MSQNGKGSSPRPFSVSYDKYADNWDAAFKKKKKPAKPTTKNGPTPTTSK